MTRLWHISIAAEYRSTLCATLSDCLAHVWRILRSFGGRVLLFCVVDDHIHIVVEGPRGVVGRQVSGFVRAVEAAGGSLQPAHFKAVNGRGHLEWLVSYVVNQPRKHGLPGHPALWPGSCFADLVDARRLEGFEPARVLAHLPRWRDRDLWNTLELRPLEPLPDRAVRRLGVWRIVDAASAAFGLDELAAYRRPEVRRARLAVVDLAAAVETPPAQLASALGVTRRSISRLRSAGAASAEPEPVRLRLALEEHVGMPRHGLGAPPEHAA